jgi:hypothetical protein
MRRPYPIGGGGCFAKKKVNNEVDKLWKLIYGNIRTIAWED